MSLKLILSIGASALAVACAQTPSNDAVTSAEVIDQQAEAMPVAASVETYRLIERFHLLA